jgi:hypothetical protein
MKTSQAVFVHRVGVVLISVLTLFLISAIIVAL